MPVLDSKGRDPEHLYLTNTVQHWLRIPGMLRLLLKEHVLPHGRAGAKILFPIDQGTADKLEMARLIRKIALCKAARKLIVSAALEDRKVQKTASKLFVTFTNAKDTVREVYFIAADMKQRVEAGRSGILLP